jgi:DNA (cytosine-5)-methyltransferase 1
MRHGSLFSGIGGFAAQWMGWENVFHCEWNEFGQKVLKYYWPEAISHSDITKIDFTPYANTIDILTGGFPCQPYSLAGKRKGKEDERHLWPEMLRAIREIQPRWVVGENVFGLINWSGGLVFHEVQADLEAEGYEVFPYVLPACAKNAPHRRDRVWFVAYSNNNRKSRRAGENESHGKEEWLQERNAIQQSFKPDNLRELSTHSESLRINRAEELGHNKGQGGERGRCDIDNFGEVSDKNRDADATNASHQGLQRGEVNGSLTGIGQERNEQLTGFLRTDWQNFPTQSPICNGNDGFSSGLDFAAVFEKTRTTRHKPRSAFPKWRNESIKAGGNAVVVPVVYEIFKAIEAYEKL